MYCETREPLTSVKIRRRSGIVRGASVVIDGRREMNSGINLSTVINRCYMKRGNNEIYPYLTRSEAECLSKSPNELV
jgi:hypothetical protein